MSTENPDLDQFKTSLGLYIDNPWERVKFIFKKNDFGEYHPDLVLSWELAQVGFFGGVGFGGILHYRRSLLEYQERNDANIYQNNKEAARQFARQSLKGFLEGALKWGPRVAIFMGGFTLFSSCVEAYRNKSGVVEYSVGGAVLGGLLKFDFGVRGMLVGSLVGMVLGTMYGLTHFGLCKLIKSDGVEIKYGQYALSKYISDLTRVKIMEKESVEMGIEPQSNAKYLNPLDDFKDDSEKKKNLVEKNLKEK